MNSVCIHHRFSLPVPAPFHRTGLILVANSWQQTPAGYHLVETAVVTRAEITSFWNALLNPSTLDCLSHTLVAAFQSGAFLVIGVGAFYLLKKRHEEFSKASIALPGLVSALVAGDAQKPLAGMTYDAKPFSGTDTIKVVKIGK